MHDGRPSPPDSGYRGRQALVRSILESPWTRVFLPAAAMYVLAAIGISLGERAPMRPFLINDQPASLFGIVCVVTLFTASHGVMPVFVYRAFLSGLNGSGEAPRTGLALRAAQEAARRRDATGATGGNPVGELIVGGFVYLHMGLWYGLPTAALGYFTNGVSLLGPVLALAFAPSGRRARAWLDYGSTSMALTLWTITGAKLYPAGLFIIPIQAALLGLMHRVMNSETPAK